MTIISYAQNFEDVILWRALGKIESGFYIDVGACSPDEHSVTRLFSERGWRGLNIEPNAQHYRDLEKRRPRDINLRIALAECSGKMPMHFFGTTGLSTLDETIATRHRASYPENVDVVEVRPLRSVWSEHVPNDQPVHFLKIDVEGFERQVLAGCDWKAQRPWVVVIEATSPLSPEPSHLAWEHLLIDAGYRAVYFDGLNRFYLAREREDLASAFGAPPNVFDDYILFAQVASGELIGDLRNSLGEKAKQLDTMSQELGEKCQEMGELRLALERRDQEAEGWRLAVSEARCQLERSSQELDEKDQEMDRLRKEGTAARRQLERRSRELVVKAQDMNLLQEEVVETRSQLERKSWEFVAKDQEIDRLRQEVAGVSRLLVGQQADSMRSEGELRRLTGENADLQAQLHGVRQEKQLIVSSMRWRITAPLWRMAQDLPPSQRRFARRLMRAAWWVVTPWHTRARLRALRDRFVRERAARPTLGAAALPAVLGINALRPLLARATGARFPDGEGPKLSFLVAAGDDALALSRTIGSLTAQAQQAWEVVVYEPSQERARDPAVSKALEGDARIRFAPSGSGLAGAFAGAIGEFVAFLCPGDLLVPSALDEVAVAIAGCPEADIFYSDEDQVSEANLPGRPYLKPSWSPDLLHAFNYFGRLTLLRWALAQKVGGIDETAGSAVEWELNLRASDDAQIIRRIPRVLCHRGPGTHLDRPAPDTPAAAEARRVIEGYWSRRGLEATAVTDEQGTQSVSWPLVRPPLVSVIIPTRDKEQLLRMSTTGILCHTDYEAIELVIVDTGSQEKQTFDLYDQLRLDPRVKIANFAGHFNYSAACNFGASVAKGEILLFLNNDIEVVTRGWLAAMVRHAMLPGVGCVGTKLIFPSLELQHGGVGIGPHLAALMYRSAEGMEFDVFGSPDHPRNWLAIMGACQMVTREAFDTVGGFDEAYQIAMSDVALCLQMWRAGYRTVYVPSACLVHHEGATRGGANPPEDVKRLADDIRALGIDEDPYLHPELDGGAPTPRLRMPGAEGMVEILRRMIAESGSFGIRAVELDLARDGEILAIVDRRRAEVFWAPQAAWKVVDEWSAARWCLDLLRRRPDIRVRFPRALSEGVDGAFARWLVAEGPSQFGLPREIGRTLHGMFAADLGGRARRLFMAREDVRRLWPHGLTPAGRLPLFRWFIQCGKSEGRLRLEEIWWLFWEAGECPEREIVQAYLFTPAWQARFPDATTPFGADRFARWFAATYRVDGPWRDPARWPLPGSPGDQVRLAWRAREEWRLLHPNALRDVDAARALLEWLASGAASIEPWARGWLASLDLGSVAGEIARPGVNVIAHFRYPSGLRISAEALVEGLDAVGMGTSLRDVRTDTGDDPGHERYDGFEVYDVTVIHTQPEPFFESVYERADVIERRPRSYRVAYWYWEFGVIPEGWKRQAAQVDEVWAATEFVAEGLRERLSVPVRTLFPGVRLAPFESRERAYFGVPEDETVFLFIFHMMSVMERKNPLGLIRAFRRAFRPDEPARLVIKTSFGERHPAQLAKLKEAAKGARITIINEVYSPDDVLALMQCCDVYVSLHRSEGLGLSMAEAMLMGKPVMATGYSGNTHFMTADNSLLVDYRLVKLGKPIPPYDADFEWAEPSEEHAAELMRKLYDDPAYARSLGERAREEARQTLSVVAAGQRVAARLAEIDAERFG